MYPCSVPEMDVGYYPMRRKGSGHGKLLITKELARGTKLKEFQICRYEQYVTEEPKLTTFTALWKININI